MKKLLILFIILSYAIVAFASLDLTFNHKTSYTDSSSDFLIRGLLFDQDIAPAKVKSKVSGPLSFTQSYYLKSEEFIKEDELFHIVRWHSFDCFISSGAQIFKEISQKHSLS